MHFNYGYTPKLPDLTMGHYLPNPVTITYKGPDFEVVEKPYTARNPFLDEKSWVDRMFKYDPEADDDPLNFLSDKARLKEKQIHFLLQHMAARLAISDDIKRSILYDQAAADGQLDQARGWRGSPAHNPKRESELEKQVQELDRERRAEDVACWRDTGRIAMDLMDLWTEYADHSRIARLTDLGF